MLALALTACGTDPDKEKIKHASAEELYQSAKTELDNSNYQLAVKTYEQLIAKYPYGSYAQQAELEMAYANFKDQEPAAALQSLDRFLKQHPTHQNADYAYYLKGLINFIEDKSFFARIANQDMAERDPKAAKESFEAFHDLVNRFPNSRYAEDSRDRMAYLITALADSELYISKYYYRRGAYLAAANRSKYVIENYGTTNRVEVALLIMAASYDRLNQKELADDARKVLKTNYPNSILTENQIFGTRAWYRFW
ncbi:outer membrane protein assembly factor BamD [Burkholderiaceae bacterium DAT-1]|nr:outer membrane protein assembly factor BamD [Burkholderiaceae bacterium DAT-1]